MSDELSKFERDKAERRAVRARKRSRKMTKLARKKKADHKKEPHNRAKRGTPPVRPFDAKERRRFLKNYEELGSKKMAAEASGFHLETIRRHLRENPLFAQQFEDTKDRMVEVLEEEAFRRAVYGYDEPIYYKGELVDYKKVYSDAMLSKLLEANAPDKYGKQSTANVKGNISVTGPDGGPVQVEDAKSRLLNIIEGQARDITPTKEDDDNDDK